MILNLLSTSLLAVTPAHLIKRVHFPPRLSQEVAYTLYDSASLKATLEERSDILQKANRLANILSTKLPVRRSKIQYMVAFIEKNRQEHPDVIGLGSLYIPKNHELPFSIQVYDNGHTYINLEEADPEKKKGGYKSFARALDYDNETFYAQLRTEVKDFYNLKKQIRELEIMDLLRDSPEALNYRDTDIYVVKEFDEAKHILSIHTEVYDTDLRSFKGQREDTEQLLTLLKGATKGLHAMHQHSVVHRDLKAANYFFRERAGTREIVIADFGLSQSADDPRFGLNLCGTRGFMAPESCHRWASDRSAFRTLAEGKAADVFSLGMVFRELIWGDQASPDSKALTQLNYAALPPKTSGKTLDPKEVESRFESFVTAYGASYPQVGDVRPRTKCLFILNALTWKMLDPHAHDRPSAEYVLQSLQDLDRTQLCANS
ncbi:MAG: protein kinase [Deltaproteobacteria bacterium]|nr:protein kinase [Deltaproteobacteria bacterium]